MGFDFRGLIPENTPEDQVDLVIRLVQEGNMTADEARDTLVSLIRTKEQQSWSKGHRSGVGLALNRVAAAGHGDIARATQKSIDGYSAQLRAIVKKTQAEFQGRRKPQDKPEAPGT